MANTHFSGPVLVGADNIDVAAVGGADFTIGDEAANVINVGVQLTDSDGDAIAHAAALVFYLSSDSAGQTIASAPDGGIAIGTDGTLVEWAANINGLAISEADGDIDIDMTESGANTFYLNLVMPNGKLVTSSAIAFTT